MSHYNIGVIIPAEGDVKDLVTEAMAPFNENRDGFVWPEGDHHHILHWDWWRIGGRWDGEIIGLPECATCATDWHHSYSTDHEKIENNCVPIRELREDYHAWGILEPDGTYTCQYTGKDFDCLPADEWLAEQDAIINRYLGYRIVTVNYHE